MEPEQEQTENRGRPAFEKTKAQSEIVSQMVACGDNQELIARHLRIDAKTLRKYFAEEILNGVADGRAEVVKTMFAMMKRKNAAATKKLEEITRMTSAQECFRAPAAIETTELDVPAPKAPKLGKKELQRANAEDVLATEWGRHLQPAIPNQAKH